MTNLDKLHSILRRYKVYIQKGLNPHFIDEIVVKHVMLIAYEKHKNIPFQEFVTNCVKNPIDYLYQLSDEMDNAFYDIHLINNCFNDKSNVHYGLKINNNWFFITHSKNNFSLPLYTTEFKMKPKDLENVSYLTSYKNTSPNILKYNVGTIKKSAIDEYIIKFMKHGL